MTTARTDVRPARRSRRLAGRPQFYRSYEQELALFNTRPKRIWVGVIIVVAFALSQVLADNHLNTFALAFAFARSASASPTSWSGCPPPDSSPAWWGCSSPRWPPGSAGSTSPS